MSDDTSGQGSEDTLERAQQSSEEQKDQLSEQQGEQQAQAQVTAAAQKLNEVQSQKKSADDALANVKKQLAAADTATQAAEQAAKPPPLELSSEIMSEEEHVPQNFEVWIDAITKNGFPFMFRLLIVWLVVATPVSLVGTFLSYHLTRIFVESFRRKQLARKARKRAQRERKAAEEGQMSDEQFEFLMAVDEYKRLNDRPFPSLTEVLDIIRALGYRKVAEPESLK